MLLLAACASAEALGLPVDLPPKPTPAPTARNRPTPFAPLAPTTTASSPEGPAAAVGSWPAPNTYGKWDPPAIPIPPPAADLPLPEGTLNLLLLGSDRRSGRGFRTDSIVIASIQPARGLAALISIPRDLYVYLPGNSISRINTAWIYGASLGYPGGGPQLLIDTIRYNLGVPIDRYALVEMDGFRRGIDALGGVEVRVACSYTDWRLRRPELPQQLASSWALFTAPQGLVHMDGDYALWYARARLRSTDFDRARRQQEVLRAAYREALRPDVLSRLPEMYAALKDAVVTDLTLDDLLQLAGFAARLEPVDLRSRFIGRPQVTSYRVPTSGAAVLLPKPEAIRELLVETLLQEPEDSRPRPRVVILPTEARDVAELARERLLFAGFAAEIAPGDPSPAPASEVRFPQGTAAEDVERVLAALGLPAGARLEAPAGEGEGLQLTLGPDYDPCFRPSAFP